MKLLDFLKSLNSAQSDNPRTIDLEHERHALLAELNGVLELLAEPNASAPVSPENFHQQLRALNLAEIFDIDEANDETSPKATPTSESPHGLTQSLLTELRQIQQRIVGDSDKDFAS